MARISHGYLLMAHPASQHSWSIPTLVPARSSIDSVEARTTPRLGDASAGIVLGSLLVLSGLGAGAFLWMYSSAHPDGVQGSMTGVTSLQATPVAAPSFALPPGAELAPASTAIINTLPNTSTPPGTAPSARVSLAASESPVAPPAGVRDTQHSPLARPLRRVAPPRPAMTNRTVVRIEPDPVYASDTLKAIPSYTNNPYDSASAGGSTPQNPAAPSPAVEHTDPPFDGRQ